MNNENKRMNLSVKVDGIYYTPTLSDERFAEIAEEYGETWAHTVEERNDLVEHLKQAAQEQRKLIAEWLRKIDKANNNKHRIFTSFLDVAKQLESE